MFLQRPNLTQTILEAVESHNLTAIVAPMGYGKTTLAHAVSEALSGMPFSREKNAVYYYAIPGGPHDGHFVWHDMCLSLEKQGLDIAPALRRLGLPETASQAFQALELLHGPDTSTCLILDDYHHVTDRVMDAFWERAARESVPNLHLVLFSRTRPGVKLEELHIKGLATFFDQKILAFSQAETEEFFRLNGVDDHTATIESWAYSEGWPAVLWLCLQSWLNNGRIIESGGVDALLASLFFAAYSPEERDLLMRLSVLENFTEQDTRNIAKAQCHSASLRKLCEKNAFLAFDAKAGRWQFHAIFRDFLRKELDHATYIDKPALYRLAGECCLERRDLVAAVRLFNRAGRDEDLARLLDIFLLPEYDETLTCFHEEISAVTNAIPWHVRMQNPMGYLIFIAVCFLCWNDARTAALLEEAAEHFSHAPDLPVHLQKQLRGELEIMRGLLLFNDVWKLLEHYRKAVRLLPGPSVIAGKGTAWSFGSPSISFLMLRDKGRYSELLEVVGQNWRLFRKLSGGLGKGGEKMFRAEYLLERGEFAGAARLAREVLNACGEDRHIAGALAASFSLARLAVITGKTGEALAILESMRSRVEKGGVYEHLEELDLAIGYVGANLARPEHIPEWLRNGEMNDPPHNAVPQVMGVSLTVHGKALLLQGEYERVAAMAEDIPVCTAPLECLFAGIHGKVLRAIAAWHTQGRSAALEFLDEALALSRPDGIVLPLAEYGRHIVPLLHRFKRTVEHDAHLAAVLTLAGQIALVTASPSVRSSQKQKNLLTPRERELMQHVAGGKTNPAIAGQLGISGNTVKNMLSRAYEKLGARSRMEAAQCFIRLYGKTDHFIS